MKRVCGSVRRPGIRANTLYEGLVKGVRGYLWLLKVMLPVSLATALLDFSGWLNGLDFLLAPLMGLIGLPPLAALPILAALTAGIYACIAAMAALPLTPEQMTVVTVFVLIAHSLPQEAAIQARSGIGFLKSTGVRLGAALATSATVAWILQPDPAQSLSGGHGPANMPVAIAPFLLQWAADTAWLCIKIFVIIVSVMVLIELLKAWRLADRCVGVLAPLLRVMGLDRRAGLLWLTGALFGLGYGGAVIVEQAQELNLTADEIEKLQLSIGIHHAIIEDPLVFMPFVVSPVYVWLPRLAAAVAVVYLVALKHRLLGRR
jgi:Fe2+ transport system protein B